MNKRESHSGLEVDPVLDLQLSFLAAGRPIKGPVVNISQQRLKVLLSGEAAQPLDVAISGARLSCGRTSFTLDRLQIQELSSESEDRHLLELAADDDATKATLWLIYYRLLTDGTLNTAEDSIIDLPAELPVIPMRGHYTEAARLARLNWLRTQTGDPLTSLDEMQLNPERLTGNIENLIGAVEVPVGIAGPLFFRGHHARGLIYAPMATTEGALVASASRGAVAISRAGGVTTRVISQRMMRVPLFVLSNLRSATILAAWIRDHLEELRAQTLQVSRHAQLVSVEPVILGNMVHVHFLYETGDAAGQNMTTSCTWKACQYIIEQLRHFPQVQLEHFLVEGNMSGDKKVTFQSLIAGRGIRVIAEAVIPREIVQNVLKAVPEEMVHFHSLGQTGAINAGMIGYNLNVANLIAALFTSTGQDIACVHESSLAQLHLHVVEGDLYVSILLPSLVIGTIGGGTHLPAQNSFLAMMGCAGQGNVYRLAEIIAGFCLALDLSTGSAISSGAFASAHDRLGRNRPVKFFTTEELTLDFLRPAAARATGDESAVVTKIEPADQAVESSIVTQFTARKVKKALGMFPLRLTVRSEKNAAQPLDVLVKIKPLDEEVIMMGNSLAGMVGHRLGAAHNKFRHRTGFASCHLRELAIYQQTDERFVRNAPRLYQVFQDPTREAYVLVIELLRGTVLMNSADDPSGWNTVHLEAALAGAAEFHSIWLGREAELALQPWLGGVMNTTRMAETTELWEELATHGHREFPKLLTSTDLEQLHGLIRSIPSWWTELEQQPRTLIHNDFNPRNITLRKEGGGYRLCAYDWELATLQVPQHDLAELLCFVLPEQAPLEQVSHLVEFHRRALEQASGRSLDEAAWRHGFQLALRDLAVNRINYYLLGHTFQQFGFLPHTLRSMFHLLELTAGW